MNKQIRRIIATMMLSPPLSILLVICLIFLVIALNPFSAAASALEAASSGVNVLGLPTPVITGIDAKNGIVQLKADGYTNENAELLATVALVDDSGNVIDVAEKKVSDPGNIRVSLRTDKINVGSVISAKFTNRGIGGDEADRTHDEPEQTEEPAPPPVEESEPPTEEPVPTPPTIIYRGGGSSSVTYIVTEAESEQIIIEKLIEAEPIPANNIIQNVPVYVYNSPDNAQSVEEVADVVEPEIIPTNSNMQLEAPKVESEIIRPDTKNLKIITTLLFILSAFLALFIGFLLYLYLSKPFSDIRQPFNVLELKKKIQDKKTA